MKSKRNIPSEMAEKAVIEPRIGSNETRIADWAIIAMTIMDVKSCLHSLGKKGKGRFFYNSSLYLEASGSKLPSVAGPFLGAPHAVLAMEKLIALGAKKILSFGLCGALQPDIEIGDLIIPEFAISEEGVSQHYPLSGIKPEILKVFEDTALELLTPLRIKLHRGGVWTTDAPFRETPGKVRDFQKKGILAVDMEFSALLNVAAFRGVDILSVMVVSDLLHDCKWHHGFKEKILYANHEKYITAIMQNWPWKS